MEREGGRGRGRGRGRESKRERERRREEERERGGRERFSESGGKETDRGGKGGRKRLVKA